MVVLRTSGGGGGGGGLGGGEGRGWVAYRRCVCGVFHVCVLHCV